MNFISGNNYNTSNKAFTTPNNCYYVTMAVNVSIEELQIETGSATTYEPYQTPQTYQLSLGEYEFAKGNDNADEIIYDIENDKVYKNEKMNKKVLNGTENWIDNNTWDSTFPEVLHCFSYMMDWLIGQTQYYCDKFICTTEANRNQRIEEMSCHTTTNSLYIFIDYSRLNGVTKDSTNYEKQEALKTWLSENKPEVWYQLNTPVLKEITGTLKDQIKALYNSHSFTGTTIIEINGQLPLIIKVRALKGE